MRRCLQLAKHGLGSVAPNPMVGAVLVVDGKIIGEGFTSPYGGPHAEVNAIAQVKDPTLLKHATLYVSLEPCAHFGKTPPCANLIVRTKIPRVVIGALDTFSAVNGKGVAILTENGVEVELGVLESECRELNKRFFTFHEKKRPYILLKWAETADGFIDKLRNDPTPKVNWITSPETKSLVHLWRSQETAILVGRKTIENDNPQLDVRLVEGKNPLRIILDPDCRINLENWKYSQSGPTLILNKKITKKVGSIDYIAIPDFNIDTLLTQLYLMDIQSVIVEGGAQTLASFLHAEMWDEARILCGPSRFHNGISAPKLQLQPCDTIKLGSDVLKVYRNV